MANKKLRITDEVNFKPIEIIETSGSISDNLGGLGQGSVTVRVAATHAGIVTRNNTFYLPDRMRAGVPTWTEQYNKPVLVHHQKDQDPIGRVIHADYVDLSGSIGPAMQNNLFRDSIVARDKFSKFIKGSMSYGLQVDYVRDNFSRADVADDKNYEGLGYIMLTATITDPDAIQKIRDGRYLTGSVSASTDRAVCSVCKQDWLDEGQCDHEPGSIYDGTKAFIIAGNFEYEEWSYVNKPADRHSKTLEIVNSVSNNKEKVQTMEAKTKEVKDNLEVVTPEAQVTTETAQVTAFTQFSDAKSEDLEAKFNEIDLGAQNFTDEQAELIYELMLRDFDAEFTDAKLSAEKRKGLASSTFCGPDKSFPVPDCAHVTAARRLIGRYKGPGDKSAILTCVARKARALGCDGAEDSVVEETPVVVAVEAPVVDTKKEECGPCKEIKDKVLAVEADNAKLKDQLKALREEYRYLILDVASLEDQLVKARIDARAARATRVADHARLEGAKSSVKELVDGMLSELDDKTLNSKFESVDMKNIIDKLNSGLSREPSGSVEPTAAIITDSSKQPGTNQANVAESKTNSDSEERKLILDTLEHMRVNSGAAAAERHKARLIRDGYVWLSEVI